jgi:hypothetical protein
MNVNMGGHLGTIMHDWEKGEGIDAAGTWVERVGRPCVWGHATHLDHFRRCVSVLSSPQGTNPMCTYALVDPVAIEGELQAEARIGQKGQEVVGQSLQLRQGAAVHEGLTHHEESGTRGGNSQARDMRTHVCLHI